MIVTILSAIGATIIVTQGSIMKPLRKYKLFRCGLCFGFHAGWMLALISGYSPLEAIKTGFIVSLCSYTWTLLMKYFIEKYD